MYLYLNKVFLIAKFLRDTHLSKSAKNTKLQEIQVTRNPL